LGLESAISEMMKEERRMEKQIQRAQPTLEIC
jgi:hypothetical protein